MIANHFRNLLAVVSKYDDNVNPLNRLLQAQKIVTTIGWLAAHSNGIQRMNPENFCDPLKVQPAPQAGSSFLPLL